VFELEPNIQLNEDLIKKEGLIRADESKSNENKTQQRTSSNNDEPAVWHYDSASSDDDCSGDEEDNNEMGLRNDSYFLDKNEQIDYNSLMNKKNWISGDILWHCLPKDSSISFFKTRLFEVTLI
jgi:uncharacterized protein RhaS with RHS repeats